MDLMKRKKGRRKTRRKKTWRRRKRRRRKGEEEEQKEGEEEEEEEKEKEDKEEKGEQGGSKEWMVLSCTCRKTDIQERPTYQQDPLLCIEMIQFLDLFAFFPPIISILLSIMPTLEQYKADSKTLCISFIRA